MGPSVYPPTEHNPQPFYRPDYQFGYPQGKGVMLVLPADPGLWSEVRQLILLEDPYHGSTDEQDRAYRDLDRITCEETKNLWSFLEDFMLLETKSGRLYFHSTTEKLFTKLPPSLSKKIEESFKAKYPGHFAKHCKSKQGNIARSAVYQELDFDDNWDIVSADFDDSSVYSISEGEGDTHQNISVMVQDTTVEKIAFMAIEEDDESDSDKEEDDYQPNHHTFMFHPEPPTKIAEMV
nr:hypothetical protein MA16_Dca024339 [Tanacetum cinerariifolium]